MAKTLTKKQRGFVNDYVMEENGTKAALKNYSVMNEHTAAVISSENLRKPEIIEAIEETRKTLKEALIEKGVTPERIAEGIDFLLESDEYQAVDKGIAHATKIYGIEEDTKPKENNTYNFIFNADVQKSIKELENSIKAKLLGHVEQNN